MLHANRAASAALGARAALRLDRGTLTANDPHYASRLRALLAQASHGIGGLLAIPGAGGKPGSLVVTAPLPPDSNFKWHGAARVLVLFSVPGRSSRRIALLARAHLLTPAEIRVLELLASDRSPADIAETLGTRVETVRSQLKSIYLKLDVHSQRELLALVSKVPPMAEP